MEVLGRASIEIVADDSKFERTLRNAAKKIKDVKVNVVADVSLAGVNKKLRDFRSRNENRVLQLKADVSTDLAQRRLDEVWDDYDGKVISMNFDLDHKDAWAAISRLKESSVANSSIELGAYLDTETLYEQLEEFREHASSPIEIGSSLATTGALADLERLQAIAENNGVEIDTEADTGLAEAELAFASRDRFSTIHVGVNRNRLQDLENVLMTSSTRPFRLFTGGNNPLVRIFNDPEISHAIEGFTNATLGIIPPRELKRVITGLAGDFEGIAVQTAKISTAVAAIGAAGVTAVGFISRVIMDVGEVVGILAMVPSIFATVRASMSAMQTAWSGIGDAMVADPIEAAKAISKMYKGAQDTARAMHLIVLESDKLIKERYWDTLGDSVKRTAEIIKMDIARGMGQVAVAMAKNTDAVSKSVRAFAQDGGIKETFDNMVRGLQNATGGTRAFSDALLTITREGSKRLPQLGEWITKIGQDFNKFIQDSAESGAILRWIDQAVQRLQELGSIVVNTTRIIESIAEAAEAAGIGGLTDLANGVKLVADAFKSFEGQTIMRDLFRDGFSAVQDMSDGFGVLLESIKSRVPQIGMVMQDAGKIVETFLRGLGSMISDTRLADGMVDLFSGVRRAVDQLEPSFESIGNIFGDLGGMFGTLLDNMAPGLNTVLQMVEGFVSQLAGGWKQVVPVLNDTVHLLTSALIGPIESLGSVIGGFLGMLSQVPPPLLLAGAAVLAFSKNIIALKAGFDSLKNLTALKNLGLALEGVGVVSAGTFTNLKGNISGIVNTIQVGAIQAMNAVPQVASGVRQTVTSLGANVASTMAMTAGSFDVSRSVQKSSNAAKGMGNVVSGLKGVFGGLKTSLGGIGSAVAGFVGAFGPMIAIGAVIGGVTAAIGAHQERVLQAEQSVKTFADSYDPLTNKMDTFEHSMTRIKDVASTYGASFNFNTTLETTLSNIGSSAEDVARKLSGSRDDVYDYASSWNHAAVEFEKFKKQATIDGALFAPAQVKEFVDTLDNDVIAKLGFTREELMAMNNEDLSNLITSMGQVGSEAMAGTEQVKMLKDELNNLAGRVPDDLFTMAQNGSQGMRDALATANDHAGTLVANFNTLQSTTSTVDQKISAMKSNMEVMRLSTAGWNNPMQELAKSTEQSKSAFAEIKKSLDETGVSAGSLVKIEEGFNGGKHAAFDFKSEAGGITSELFDTISAASSAIISSTAGEYDKALAKTGNVSTAITEASLHAKAESENLAKALTDIGLEADVVQGILDSFGLEDSDIEASLMVNGVDTAIQDLMRVEMAMHGLKTGDWSAYLKVAADDAMATLGRITGLGEEFTQKELEAKINADDSGFNMTFEELMIKMAQAEDPMKVLLEAHDGASGVIDPVIDKLETGFDGQIFKGVAQIDDQASSTVSSISDVAYDALGNPFVMTVEGRDYASESIGNIKNVITDLPTTIHTTMDIIDNATPSLVAFKQQPEPEKLATITALDQYSDKIREFNSMSAEDKEALITAIDEANPKLKGWNLLSANDKSALLSAVDFANPTLAEWNAMPAKTKEALITAVDKAMPKMSKWVNMSMPDKTSTMDAVDKATKKVGNWNSLSMSEKKSFMDVVDKASPKNSAWNRMPMEDKKAILEALDLATKKNRDWNAYRMNNKEAQLTAKDLTGTAKRAWDNWFPKSKTATFTQVTQHVVRGANNAVRSYAKNAASWLADGGVLSGSGVQTFANGGFSKALQSIQMHAFAGGSEKHIAQIARGGYPYRVWAEPETGGEAYIPLAKAKRTRSLKILEQVANHFGLSLMQQFADGGFSSYVPPRGGIQSFANGGTSLTDRRNNYNNSLRNAIQSLTRTLRESFTSSNAPILKTTEAMQSMVGEIREATREAGRGINTRPAWSVANTLQRNQRFSNIWYDSKGNTNISKGLDALNRGLTQSGGINSYGKRMGITLKDLEYGQHYVNLRLEEANNKLREQIDLRDQLAKSVTDMSRGTYSIADATKIAHEAGQPVTAKTLTKSANAVIHKNNILNRRVQEMRKRGFAPAIIAEVAQLGLSEGIATADMLLKSPAADIKALNYAYKRLDETSTVLGNTTANIMYKAGIDAADGVVKGLEYRLSEIENAGLKLSNALISSFKKALGIKSPSRVMRDEVGSQIVDGLVLGITSNIGKVDKARKSLDLAVGASAWGNVGSADLGLSDGLAPNRGTVVNYNITNHNPVEEKTSDTMRKNNQNLSLIGLA